MYSTYYMQRIRNISQQYTYLFLYIAPLYHDLTPLYFHGYKNSYICKAYVITALRRRTIIMPCCIWCVMHICRKRNMILIRTILRKLIFILQYSSRPRGNKKFFNDWISFFIYLVRLLKIFCMKRIYGWNILVISHSSFLYFRVIFILK